jgi:hypothetical protein
MISLISPVIGCRDSPQDPQGPVEHLQDSGGSLCLLYVADAYSGFRRADDDSLRFGRERHLRISLQHVLLNKQNGLRFERIEISRLYSKLAAPTTTEAVSAGGVTWIYCQTRTPEHKEIIEPWGVIMQVCYQVSAPNPPPKCCTPLLTHSDRLLC